MKSVPKHAKDRGRGTIRLSDFRPSNLHPKAKFRIAMALIGAFLIILGCVYMLSSATITLNPDLNTSAGISAMMKNCLAALYVIGSIITIIILFYVMFHDTPISPAAKANYVASHDKSMKGVKVVASLASAIANKGTGQSIDSVAVAVDDYFNDGSGNK